MLKIAVLASGRGTNFQAILNHIRADRILADPVLVLSNVPGAPVTDLAREAGIPVWAESHRAYPSRLAFDRAMLTAMRAASVQAVVLAGYMRLLSPEFIQAYPGAILNIHPSLLPAFPGASGGADALSYGVKLAGCTVHFVTEDMDAGPVIIQAAVPVAQDDTADSLMARIHVLEHRIYPQAVAWMAEGRLRVDGRTVCLLPRLDSADNMPACGSVCPALAGNCGQNSAVRQSSPCLISPALDEGF